MQARLYTGNLYMHQSHSWPIVTKCHNINNSQYKPFNAKYGLFSAICVMHVECIKSNGCMMIWYLLINNYCMIEMQSSE